MKKIFLYKESKKEQKKMQSQVENSMYCFNFNLSAKNAQSHSRINIAKMWPARNENNPKSINMCVSYIDFINRSEWIYI